MKTLELHVSKRHLVMSIIRLHYHSVGIIDNPRDSLFTYQFGESWSTFYFPFFTPAYEPLFSDPSLKQKADEICGDDEFCKFDIAATGRVEIGETTNQAVQEVEKLINLSRPSKFTMLI